MFHIKNTEEFNMTLILPATRVNPSLNAFDISLHILKN